MVYTTSMMIQEQFTRIAKALADRRRFEILAMIAAENEVAGMAMVEACPVSQATISHHLKELASAGLIDVRREGQSDYYRVTTGLLPGSTRSAGQLSGRGRETASRRLAGVELQHLNDRSPRKLSYRACYLDHCINTQTHNHHRIPYVEGRVSASTGSRFMRPTATSSTSFCAMAAITAPIRTAAPSRIAGASCSRSRGRWSTPSA